MAPMIKPMGKIVSIAKSSGSMNLGRLFAPEHSHHAGIFSHRVAEFNSGKLSHALSIAPPYLTRFNLDSQPD